MHVQACWQAGVDLNEVVSAPPACVRIPRVFVLVVGGNGTMTRCVYGFALTHPDPGNMPVSVPVPVQPHRHVCVCVCY